jgi:septum formation protein
MPRRAAAMISPENPLLLGSASPRRRELLAVLRIPFRVAVAGVDEDVCGGESPEGYLERVVPAKLAAVLGSGRAQGVGAVLVADTIVVLEDTILGKPADVDEAEGMLARLSGRSHRVLTRYAIARGSAPHAMVAARTVQTRVTMRSASAVELRRYAESGEGFDKAGAYAVQGLGSFLVERLEGSYANVVGLPVCEVVLDLQSAGLLRELA